MSTGPVGHDALFDRVRQRQRVAPIRIPVGVVGPGNATPAQYAAAQALGRGLAQMGLALLCGGRAGVMEAACRGAAEAGGVAIGLLPGTDAAAGNPYATVLIPSGIGDARNAVIARAALCLVAVGNNLGTLSEVALGLQFGKLVVGLEGAAAIDGVLQVASVPSALAQVAHCMLAVPTAPG